VFYAAFAFWLVMVLFAGVGIYRLWKAMVKPAWVNWALLPGTIVSEMGYIFGCLITGGEVRRAKLIDSAKPKGKQPAGETATDASSGLKALGAVVASLISMVACFAAVVAALELLGTDVVKALTVNAGLLRGGLPQELPLTWNALWAMIDGQVLLLRRMCETLASSAVLSWRGVLFVYLAACLSIRLSPVTRPMRATLAAAVIISALIALLGVIWRRVDGLVDDAWPLLTYIWASLLFLLVVTLLARGIVALVRILAGKKA